MQNYSKTELETLGSLAAKEYLRRGVPLSKAVAGVVQSSPGLTKHHIQRVVENANREVFRHSFGTSNVKVVDFPVATFEDVSRHVMSGLQPRTIKVASRDFSDPPPRVLDDSTVADAFIRGAFTKTANAIQGYGAGSPFSDASSPMGSMAPGMAGTIPAYHDGGVVEGRDGEEVVARLLPGEVVVNPELEGLSAQDVSDAIEDRKRKVARAVLDFIQTGDNRYQDLVDQLSKAAEAREVWRDPDRSYEPADPLFGAKLASAQLTKMAEMARTARDHVYRFGQDVYDKMSAEVISLVKEGQDPSHAFDYIERTTCPEIAVKIAHQLHPLIDAWRSREDPRLEKVANAMTRTQLLGVARSGATTVNPKSELAKLASALNVIERDRVRLDATAEYLTAVADETMYALGRLRSQRF